MSAFFSGSETALTAVSRAICLDTAVSLDMANATEGAERDYWKARGALLTPIAKAFSTDIGFEVASLGVQVHGGMGFVEETGAAQFMRDVRVTSIYEGTNGIQSMDLVGRKLMDGGVAARAMLKDVTKAASGPHQDAVKRARDDVGEATEWMLRVNDINDRFAGSAPYLRAWAIMLGAHYLNLAAEIDPARAPLADFYMAHIAPQIAALTACIGMETSSTRARSVW